MPKWLSNFSHIFKVPKQHSDPIPVFKFRALQYLLASGLGQQAHSAVVTPTSYFFIGKLCIDIADLPLSSHRMA